MYFTEAVPNLTWQEGKGLRPALFGLAAASGRIVFTGGKSVWLIIRSDSLRSVQTPEGNSAGCSCANRHLGPSGVFHGTSALLSFFGGGFGSGSLSSVSTEKNEHRHPPCLLSEMS